MRSGFSLLELLIALAVFGLVMIGLENAVHFALAAWKSEDREMARDADLDVVDRALRRLFLHIPLSAPDPGTMIFEGTASQARFVSLLPEGVATERLAQCTLLIDQHRLILRWRPAPHRTGFGPKPLPLDVVILDHVDRLELAYNAGNTAAGWKTVWQERAPPKLVRVTVVFPEGDQRHWPTLVMALTPGLGNS